MNSINGFFKEYRWLSNFHEATIVYNGHWFKTNEHAYQAAKCAFYEDFCKVKEAKLAKEAMALGRKAIVRQDWEEIKVQVMLEMNRIKFNSHKDLADKLLATGDKYLEETNTWKDTFWGVCDGVGENNLGKILMQVREELKNA